MTKYEIISEYNKLTPTLNSLYEEYKVITGNEYPGRCQAKDMDSSKMSWSKQILAGYLIERDHTVTKIKKEIDTFCKVKAMNSTPEGKMFLESIDERIKKAEEGLDLIAEEMYGSLSGLLESIGLSGWNPKPTSVAKTIPTTRWESITIHDMAADPKKSGYPYLSLYIEKRNGKWDMQVNCGVSGPQSIGDTLSRQNREFKAYVTICDHAEKIQEWMDTEYQDMAHRAYDLRDEINAMDRVKENPYEEFIKTKTAEA